MVKKRGGRVDGEHGVVALIVSALAAALSVVYSFAVSLWKSAVLGRIDKAEKRIEELPDQYVTMREYERSIGQINHKLDLITDLMMKRWGHNGTN